MSGESASLPSSSAPYAGNGWTCHVCGTWVMTGSTHQCPGYRIGSPPPAPDPTAPEWAKAHALSRIAAALEKLADAKAGG